MAELGPTESCADRQPSAFLRARRSIRTLDTRPVPRELVERLLAAATLAPSPHNAQPWRFAVVVDPSARQRLAEAMRRQWQADLARDGWADEQIRRRTQRAYDRVVRAPVAILVARVNSGLDDYPDPARRAAEQAMATQAIGAAVQNLLLEAAAVGLAGSWICAPLFCGATVRASLDLPYDWEPQALLLIGYPAADPPRRPRIPAAALTLWR